MNKKRWWLSAILGVIALYFLVLATRYTPLEKDIQLQAESVLTANDHHWATVTVEGRDVLLEGTAPTETALNHAIETVVSLEGVRHVEHRITLSTYDTPHFNLIHEDGNTVLLGRFPTQELIEKTVREATNHLGTDPIINRLVVSHHVSSPTWLPDTLALLPTIKDLSDADFTIDNDTATLNGTFHTFAEKQAFSQLANERLKIPLTDNSIVIPLGPTPEELARVVDEAEAAEERRIAEAEASELAEEAVATQAQEQRFDEQQRLQTAVTHCQDQLNTTMDGKTILFASAKSDINTKSYSLLDTLSLTARDCGETLTASNRVITIEGHTDSRGAEAMNLKLSEARANSVRDYLLNKGVRAPLLTSKGYGEAHPVVSNATAAGRQKNRRIQFTIQ